MKKIFTLFALAFLGANMAIAQTTVEVKGTVTDADSKEPLAGAVIRIDKVKSKMTDAAGKFVVDVPEGEHEMHVSYIGYKTNKQTITVKAGDKIDLKIELKSSTLELTQVVTVSQYNKNSAKETVTTEVITKDQIKNTNSNSLGEIVTKTPGVLVQDGQISIRGGSSYSYGVGTRTAVLVDGLNLTSQDLQQVQGSFVPVENVKQVEVVKGASSVVYGSQALDGVVNIITAWPTDVDPKTEIETNVGVYDHPKDLRMKWWDSAPPFFGSVNVNHEHTFNHVQLICGGNITYSNSYLQDNNDYRARAFFKTRYLNPKMPGLSLMLGGSFQLERIDQFFVSMDMDSLAFVPKSYSSSAYELFILDPHIWYSNLKGHRYHLDMRYMNIFRKGNGTDPNAVSHGLEVDNQYQYKYHGDMLIVTAGVPLNVGVSRSNLYTGTHINFFTAAYAQAEFNYKALELQAGLRYEVQGVDTTIIKSRPVFRSGINVQASKATWFRASWGQGYRAPSVAEKYLASNFTSGIVIIPNDTLKEETSWSLELGFRQGFLIRKSWKLFFDAAFFWQEYKNYVEYVVGVWDNKNSRGDTLLPRIYEFPSPGSGKVIGPKPFNVDNARTGGYELTLTSDGKIGPVGIKMLAGYTYTYPVNTSDSVKYKVGDYLHDLFKYNFQKLPAKDSDLLVPLSIRHLIHADLELTYWKAYLGTSFSYYGAPARNVPKLFAVGEKFLFSDPYSIEKYIAKHQSGDFVIDIRAGIKINEHFSMGFIVKNLTNHFYELRPGIAEPLRNYTIQFRYKF